MTDPPIEVIHEICNLLGLQTTTLRAASLRDLDEAELCDFSQKRAQNPGVPE
jgi:hypothetical protein